MNTVFMHGIAGAGMRGLAYLLSKQGKEVCGTDGNKDALANDRVLSQFKTASEGEAADLLASAETYIYSDAVAATHPLREAAAGAGIMCLPYNEALGLFSVEFTTIAVTGTHGKSSTTAFLAHVLIELGLDPTVVIGAKVPGWEGENARLGSGDLLVVEADEYRKHFLALNPKHILLTSIDFDHSDYFQSLADVEAAYSDFMSRLVPGGSVITHQDLVDRHPDVDWTADLIALSKETCAEIKAPLPGGHMRDNACLVTEMVRQLGVAGGDVGGALATFPGLGRRFEEIGTYRGVPVFSDYGHHPVEVAATVAAAKETEARKRLLVLLEPHTLERVNDFAEEFVQALGDADGVLLMPIFLPAGRNDQDAVAESLQESLLHAIRTANKEREVRACDEIEEVEKCLGEIVDDFDVILAFSAGKLDSVLRKIVILG